MLGGERDEASGTVMLVEGHSDRLAVEALAARLGHDLSAARVTIVSMDGVTNLHHHLGRLAVLPEYRRVIGLFDAPELAHVQRAVEELGLGPGGTREELVAVGFFACEPDLEGELIRALGVSRMEELLAEHGELARFRRFQKQPEWRGRPTDAQLRRFLGTHAGRKARFAPIMIEALDENRIPAPLCALIGVAAAPS